MAYLEIKNLKKRFGNTSVLHGIDFSMKKGEAVAVLGASGGGKTTFLRCLNFLEIADEGTIAVEDGFCFDAITNSTSIRANTIFRRRGLFYYNRSILVFFGRCGELITPLTTNNMSTITNIINLSIRMVAIYCLC